MSAVQMIAINKIRVLNPRARNRVRFAEIVTNVSKVGLKKPITVCPRAGSGGEYDLVCGQGRLEALAKLRTEYPDLKLVLIGRLKEGSIAQRTIEELGLWDAVEFVSGVSDERIVELYNESACAVVPSLYEGFSLPAIEAMATGCPLVATTGGALPEVTGSDGETCYSVAPADSEALATGIRRALDDPEGSARIGAAGRDRVITRWSWRNTAERTVEHYRALLAES